MNDLIPIALIVLLLAMATGRWLTKRSLGLLTVEQKARVMETSSTGTIWPLACLAAGVGLFTWVLPGRIPLSYFAGCLAVFILTLVLVSVGGATSSLIRLSRAGLPRTYVRSAAFRAILFFGALLVLISVFIYHLATSIRDLEHRVQSSNQSLK